MSRRAIALTVEHANHYYHLVKTRRTLENLSVYTPGERRSDAIKLSSNENPRGPSPLAIEAISRALPESHIYPDGAARELRGALAERHGCAPDRVIVGNGSDEVLTMIAAAYLNPGDRVLIGKHTFSQYEFSARLFDAEVDKVEMPGLAFDLDRFLSAITPVTRVVYLCSPNNPTGLAISQDNFDRFYRELDPDVLLVIDHAYVDYVEDDGALKADALVSSVNPPSNVIVLHTFSKLWGLAALRIGYGLAHADRITDLEKVRSPFNVGSLGQIAALAALRDDEFAKESRSTNRLGMDRMKALCSELGLATLPSQANFITVEVPGEARSLASEIAERGVTVRALTSFGLPHHLRITIGTPEQIDQVGGILTELFGAG